MTQILITPTDKKVWEIKARISELKNLDLDPATHPDWKEEVLDRIIERLATLQKQLSKLGRISPDSVTPTAGTNQADKPSEVA